MKPTLDALNEEFGEKVLGIVCNNKSMYAYLKCKYKDCKYEHWFKYDKGEKGPGGFAYERSINNNHSLAAHNGATRDMKLFL